MRKQSLFFGAQWCLALLLVSAELRAEGVAMFVLDASGSMNARIGLCSDAIPELEGPHGYDVVAMQPIPVLGEKSGPAPVPVGAGSRMARARDLIRKLSLQFEQHGFRLGLVVFGNARGPAAPSCSAIEVISDPAAGATAAEIAAWADSIAPRGVTPLGRAMQLAGERLNRERAGGPRQLVVITDGGENCGHDPVSVAADLRKRFGVAIHIVALDTCGLTREHLKSIAEGSGGTFDENGVPDDFIEQALSAAKQPERKAESRSELPRFEKTRGLAPAKAVPKTAPAKAAAQAGGAGDVSFDPGSDTLPTLLPPLLPPALPPGYGPPTERR